MRNVTFSLAITPSLLVSHPQLRVQLDEDNTFDNLQLLSVGRLYLTWHYSALISTGRSRTLIREPAMLNILPMLLGRSQTLLLIVCVLDYIHL